MTKRVVVTGLSAVTPIGHDLQESWENLLAGTSGIGPITRFDATAYNTRIAGQINDFPAEKYVPAKQLKRMDHFIAYALACAEMLIKDADYEITPEREERIGCIMGCGIGGLQIIESNHAKLLDSGPRKVSPFLVPMMISNMAPGMVSIFNKCKGNNVTTTSACASGLHGIGYAFSEILLGRADAMITGGVESTITPLGMAGFTAIKAMSTRNDDPQRASRPFDRDRDGFVMGEGCGMLLLESLESAKARGAKIYAELVGFGASSDAFHMTAPEEDGKGMAQAMLSAIREAGITPADVDHVNAHATSTPLNDRAETKAMNLVFGENIGNVAVTANKSQIGHLLGAAGGVEGVFSAMTLAEGVIPPTTNLENKDPECNLDVVTEVRRRQVNYALCNSFGFGGTNASVLFKRYED